MSVIPLAGEALPVGSAGVERPVFSIMSGHWELFKVVWPYVLAAASFLMLLSTRVSVLETKVDYLNSTVTSISTKLDAALLRGVPAPSIAAAGAAPR